MSNEELTYFEAKQREQKNRNLWRHLKLKKRLTAGEKSKLVNAKARMDYYRSRRKQIGPEAGRNPHATKIQ